MKKSLRKRRKKRFIHMLNSTRSRFIHCVILTVCVLIIASSLLLPPDQIISKKMGLRWFFYCLMDDIFGLKCASCGLIRSFSAISRGQIAESFNFYHIGPVIFAFILLQIPYRSWIVMAGPKSVPLKIQQGHLFIVSIFVMIIIADWLFLMGGNIL